MRALALYLPQFHTFKENDEWWGEGYTEWTAVKRGKPFFKGQIQPRIPADGNYYDLSEESGSTLKKQADLAKKYGIYGFVFYQYYFTGHKLMERPMEILLEHPEIDLKYCISWANETWTRAWYDKKDEVLIEQRYGEESEWRAHFEYLLRFFKDERYIKVDGRPVLCIYRTFDIKKLDLMKEKFDAWALAEGFKGIYLVGGKTAGEQDHRNICDAYYYFEPGFSLKHGLSPFKTLSYNVSTGCRHLVNIIFKKEILERRIPIEWILNAIIKRKYEKNEYPGMIARWDNTPRRGFKGLVYTGASPERFYSALCKLKQRIPEDSFVFINAWNEWGEGAMLEADKAEGPAYMEAVKRAIGEER